MFDFAKTFGLFETWQTLRDKDFALRISFIVTQGEGLIYVGRGTSNQLFFSHRLYVAVSCYAKLLKMEIRYQKSNSVLCGKVTLLKNSDLNNSIIDIIDTSPILERCSFC